MKRRSTPRIPISTAHGTHGAVDGRSMRLQTRAIHALEDIIQAPEREWLCAVFLNSGYEILEKHTYGTGRTCPLLYDASAIFVDACDAKAAYVLTVRHHNHPGNLPNLSHTEVSCADRLFEAAQQAGIPLYDHLSINNRGDRYSARGAVYWRAGRGLWLANCWLSVPYFLWLAGWY